MAGCLIIAIEYDIFNELLENSKIIDMLTLSILKQYDNLQLFNKHFDDSKCIPNFTCEIKSKKSAASELLMKSCKSTLGVNFRESDSYLISGDLPLEHTSDPLEYQN
jgi:hypothetical protein